MRNQYKILQEKYLSEINVADDNYEFDEGKKEIMAGINAIADVPPVVYGIETSMCRGMYDREDMVEYTWAEIEEDFFNEEAREYFLDMDNGYPELDDFLERLKTYSVETINGEESIYWFSIDPVALEKAVDDYEEEEDLA